MVPETLYESNQPTSTRGGGEINRGRGRGLSIHKVENTCGNAESDYGFYRLTKMDTRKEMIDLGRGEETVSFCCSKQEHCCCCPILTLFLLRLYRKNYTECDGYFLRSNEFFDGRD